MWLAAVVAVLGGSAWAAPVVTLDATLRPDLQTVVGTLTVEPGSGLRFVDGLRRVPVPDDDQLQRMTFPGPVESGWLHMEQRSETEWWFYAVLPRRYGASGRVPGRGVFLNGLWHPQPMQGETLAAVEWDAQVRLPPGLTGVLNGAVSERRVRWSGTAEWLALAALEDARVQTLDLPVGTVTLVDQGPPRARRDAHLTSLIASSWPGPQPPALTVVETPSRRRLVRAGPGVLYLSDRALRVTGGLKVFHEDAVRLGMMEAGLPVQGSYARSLAAAALADAAPAPDLRQALGWFSWIPQIDSLLYTGRMPFYSEVFAEAWPGDRVLDDVREVLDPPTPGRAVTRRLDLRFGEGTAERLAWALAHGQTLPEACTAQGIPLADVLAWRRRPAPEEVSLVVEPAPDGETQVVLRREAPENAPPEPIAIQIDEEVVVWEAGPADAEHRIRLSARPERVRVDPDGLLLQTNRADDRWPTRWTAIAYLWWSDLTFTGGGLSAGGTVLLRRQYATRNLYALTAGTSPQDTVSGGAQWTHLFGPLLDRRQRPYRLSVGAGPALLAPAYRPTDGGRVALEAWSALTWSTFVDGIFPRKGHRLAVAVSGGQVVASQDNWASVSGSARGTVGAWGRVALAGRLRGGLATGNVEHRLLPLGGGDGVQGLAAAEVVGRQLVLANAELRVQPIRFASIPAPLLWLSDLQLGGGVDVGLVGNAVGEGISADGAQRTAVGWTASAGGAGDVLGAQPAFLGVWVGGPLWASDPALASGPLQVYLRINQPF